MLIDHRFYGRTRMQAVGFIAIFIIPASLFTELQHPGTPVKIFQFMYFFSSFWSQFGPNSTTFLLAAEIYPAPVRATAHGFSADCGKLGAHMPAVIYNYVSNGTKFWIVSWFGMIGFLLTVLFVADTTGLDLREQERYWAYVREGREHDYHGIAIHPRHLSFWEIYVLHRNRYYDPESDRKAKIEELRSLYDALISSGKLGTEDSGTNDDISENVSRYFQMEKRRMQHTAELPKDGKEKITEVY
jgi:hypothetical protein